jgi:hypothetical protein
MYLQSKLLCFPYDFSKIHKYSLNNVHHFSLAPTHPSLIKNENPISSTYLAFIKNQNPFSNIDPSSIKTQKALSLAPTHLYSKTKSLFLCTDPPSIKNYSKNLYLAHNQD